MEVEKIEMSYIRNGTILKYFKGKSKNYVFQSVTDCDCEEKSDCKHSYVHDYSSEYKDKEILAELLLIFIKRVTKDEEYVKKMSKVLAREIGAELRQKPLNDEEVIERTFEGLIDK